MNAVQDHITGEGLENRHQMKPIMEVENAAFLPSKEDNNDLLYDFVLLRTRDLAENVPACASFRDVVVSQMISHTNSPKKWKLNLHRLVHALILHFYKISLVAITYFYLPVNWKTIV